MPYKPPVAEVLDDKGWKETEQTMETNMLTKTFNKDGKSIEMIDAPLWFGDHIVLNSGIMYFFKCYDYCEFVSRMNDITIATDIANMKSLAEEDGITSVIILDSIGHGNGVNDNIHLLSEVKANIIKSGIFILESTSLYETASLVCGFSDPVDFD